MNLINTVDTYDNDNNSALSRSSSERDEPQNRKCSKHHYTRFQRRLRKMDIKRQLSWSKSCKEMCNSRPETILNVDPPSTPKWDVLFRIKRYYRTDRQSMIDADGKSRYNYENDLAVIYHLSYRSRGVYDYRTYSFPHMCIHYDDKVNQSVTKWAKYLQVQTK